MSSGFLNPRSDLRLPDPFDGARGLGEAEARQDLGPRAVLAQELAPALGEAGDAAAGLQKPLRFEVDDVFLEPVVRDVRAGRDVRDARGVAVLRALVDDRGEDVADDAPALTPRQRDPSAGTG